MGHNLRKKISKKILSLSENIRKNKNIAFYLRLVEALAIFITGVLAILSVFATVKNNDGSITKVGLIIGILIIVSFLSSLVAKELNYRQKISDEQADAKNHSELLENANRSLYPIGDTSIDFRFYLELDGIIGNSYKNLISKYGSLFDLQGKLDLKKLRELQITTPLIIPKTSPIFPKGVLCDVIESHFFTLEFYKNINSCDNLLKPPHLRTSPDLAIEIQTKIMGYFKKNYQNHVFNLTARQLGLTLTKRDYSISHNHWFKSGNLTSSLDLLDAVLVVRICKKLGLGDPGDEIMYNYLESKMQLNWITIDIRGFPRLCFRGELFKRYSDFDGYPVFVSKVPGRFEDIAKMQPRPTSDYNPKPSGGPDGVLKGWYRLY